MSDILLKVVAERLHAGLSCVWLLRVVLKVQEEVLRNEAAGMRLLRLLKTHWESLRAVKICTSPIQTCLLLLLLLWTCGEWHITALKGPGLQLLIEVVKWGSAALITLLPLLLEANK